MRILKGGNAVAEDVGHSLFGGWFVLLMDLRIMYPRWSLMVNFLERIRWVL
jgi:hypothetical protein